MIELNGATLDKLSFKDSNKTLIVTFDGDKKSKLTINRAVVDDPIMFDLGGTAYAFGSMPGGVTYADNKKSLKIADPFSGTLDANDYAASVVTLDGSTATGNIELIGESSQRRRGQINLGRKYGGGYIPRRHRHRYVCLLCRRRQRCNQRLRQFRCDQCRRRDGGSD